MRHGRVGSVHISWTAIVARLWVVEEQRRLASEALIGIASDNLSNWHRALELRLVQVVKQMIDHEHVIYAPETSSY